MYGCPKRVSLDEALRQTRGGGRTERVAVVQEVDEVVDSDAKRCRTHEEREGLGDGREVGPRDAKAAYFHNLIDRWKCVESFGEDENDRGSAASEGEVPKQCWRPSDAMGESDNWTVLQQDYRHLADRWKWQ